MSTPCSAPLYRSGSRVQSRYDARLGRIDETPAVFKPRVGWVYRVRLDGSVSPIIYAERALQRPEMPEIGGNVVALFGAVAVQPEMPGAA